MTDNKQEQKNGLVDVTTLPKELAYKNGRVALITGITGQVSDLSLKILIFIDTAVNQIVMNVVVTTEPFLKSAFLVPI